MAGGRRRLGVAVMAVLVLVPTSACGPDGPAGGAGSAPAASAPTASAPTDPGAAAGPFPDADSTAPSGSAGAGSVATASPTAAAPPGATLPRRVPAALFGTHVIGLAKGGRPMPSRAGAVRLWDSGVAWRLIEPAKGSVHWSLLDAAVTRAERMGASEIVWVYGSPPRWAAKDPTAPGLYGPGTSSVPDTAAYLSILRRIATRYKGRITAYEAWNEANIGIFYQGSGRSMATLTAKARAVLRRADPDALLVGASTTVRAKGPVRSWYDQYARALAARDWPVDAMAVHLYPKADEGPDVRARYLRTMQGWLSARGWTGALWDTEINYGDRRDFATQRVAVPQSRAAAWVARTYIDSLALGVDRVFWYSWNDHSLGIDQVSAASGATLPAGRAFLTVQRWLAGAQWRGCTGELVEPTGDRGAVTTCTLTLASGGPAELVFTHRGTARVEVPVGASRACRLDGTCPRVGDRITVGISPVLLRG